ncbi:hypothetical protein JCM21900_002329 [Sporobolomyces salmonicolor]
MYLKELSATSLSVPKSATAAAVAAAFSLDHVWSAAGPSTSTTGLGLSLSDTVDYLEQRWNVSSRGIPNVAFAPDPFGNGQDEDDLPLKVTYPVGTRDGTQFFMTPFQSGTTVQTAVLKYEIAFDSGFDFVKGGKLPGLYGSQDGAQSVCSGGNRQPTCFSGRLMWRQRGAGEVYAYIPIYSGFCGQSDVICNNEYGVSLSRGSFHLAAGGWTTITQLVSLNTPGYANGLLYLWANDTLALAQTGVVWRTDDSVVLSNIMFSTFFGGSDSTWDSQGGSSYFRSFEVYAASASSNTTGPAVNATLDYASSASFRLQPGGPTSTFSAVSLLMLVTFLLQCLA